MTHSIKDRPNHFPLPPVLVLCLLALGFAAKHFAPSLALLFTPASGVVILGWVLIAGALTLDIWAAMIFRAAKTNIMPTKPAEALVSHGPFKFSRNPIYLGNLMILIGAGLSAGIGLLFLFVPVAFFVLQEFQIKPEEAHLAARFPEGWAAYKAKVRRWI